MEGTSGICGQAPSDHPEVAEFPGEGRHRFDIGQSRLSDERHPEGGADRGGDRAKLPHCQGTEEGMIYTMALNPAIDRTMWVERMDFHATTRVRRESRYPGGKGIDVSRVLTGLGVPNVALGFVGGFVGEELEFRLGYDGVQTDMVRISRETRTNIIVNETAGKGRHLLLTAKGPKINPYELCSLFRKIESLSEPTMMAVGGSLPRGVNPDAYRRIITTMKRKGAITILDADGENLRCGIKACPDYIKPNRHEISELVGRKLSTLDEFIQAAEEVRSHGGWNGAGVHGGRRDDRRGRGKEVSGHPARGGDGEQRWSWRLRGGGLHVRPGQPA